MDETFVFLRKGSKRRPSQVATNTVDREDVLCAIPKPSYNFLLILSIIQFLIIIAGCIAFGALGHLTCKHLVSTECDENNGNHFKNKNSVTKGPNDLTNSYSQDHDTTIKFIERLNTASKTKATKFDIASKVDDEDTNSKRSFFGDTDALKLKGKQIFNLFYHVWYFTNISVIILKKRV